jgi:four helix bundle protein
MGKVKTFKDLDVWRKAYGLSLDCYRVSKPFPREELYGLTAELRKTARSIPCNIAEGNSRRTTTEYLRFLDIAQGSRGELETLVMLARDLEYLQPKVAQGLLDRLEEIDRMLGGLEQALQRRQTKR